MTEPQEHHSDIVTACEQMGGRLCKHKDGDYWRFTVDKFTIEIEAWSRPGRSLAGIDCAIGHVELGALVCQIFGDVPDTFQCMRWEQRTFEVSSEEQFREGFTRLLSGLLDEVRAMRLDDLIEEFRRTRPDRPSMPQLFHIAALAWVGDFTTLEDYAATFRRGHRLNFVPMISAAMIARAVSIAMDRYCGDKQV